MAEHVSPGVPTVLLVGSTPDERLMYAEYLRLCGLHPVEIENTGDACRAATTADVIVTGINVQGPFDGVELVRRLRKSPDTNDTPIIVLTACVWAPDQQRARAAGCDTFLRKPCLPEQLVSEIHAVLARRRPSKPHPGHADANHRNRHAS